MATTNKAMLKNSVTLMDKVNDCLSVLTKIYRVLCLNGQHTEGQPLSPDQQDAKDLLTSKEVQSLFGIVHSTYYRWIDRGYLKPLIVGGKHYHRTKDVHRLLQKRKYRERGGLDGTA